MVEVLGGDGVVVGEHGEGGLNGSLRGVGGVASEDVRGGLGVSVNVAHRFPDGEDEVPEVGSEGVESFGSGHQDEDAEIRNVPVLEREESRLGVSRGDGGGNLEVGEDEGGEVGGARSEGGHVIEAEVDLAVRVDGALAAVGLDHRLDYGGTARTGRSGVLNGLAAHVPRSPNGRVEDHDAAVGVEESSEPDDGLAHRGVLREVQRLGHGDVEPSGEDLRLRLPVIARRHQLDIEPSFREIP
mmetsp:Transcript_13669/g.43167  ORF Transcript_13669/g.43167 Transcript_13669/m.43167 type:complete len:242 (-) Transcript_13669:193-918(-)